MKTQLKVRPKGICGKSLTIDADSARLGFCRSRGGSLVMTSQIAFALSTKARVVARNKLVGLFPVQSVGECHEKRIECSAYRMARGAY